MSKVIKYLEYIKTNPPKSFPKYFHLETEDNDKFIIDAKKLKLLPIDLTKYSGHDEFFIQIDIKTKLVFYYAFDIANHFTNEFENETHGLIELEKVENSIRNFIIQNIKELCGSDTPATDLSLLTNNTANTTPSGARIIPSSNSSPEEKKYIQPGYPNYSHQSNYNNWQYNAALFKERDAFNDKMTIFNKEYKTSLAIDFIKSSFVKMNEDKNYELIDAILKYSTDKVDKLNIPIMIEFLKNTKEVNEHLKDRVDFLTKVKKYITRFKPSFVEKINSL